MRILVVFQRLLIDWPLGPIMIGCLFILIGIAFWGIFVVVDSFLPQKHGTGRVVGKIFTPAHTTMIMMYDTATKMSIPRFISRSDDWSVTVSINGRQDNVSVSKELYNALSENSVVRAKYVIGRFSGGLYLKDLFLR